MTTTASMIFDNIWQGIYYDPIILPLAACLTALHGVLAALFASGPKGPWKDTAIFSAKQVITLGMMVYQTYVGFLLWHGSKEYSWTENPPTNLVVDEMAKFQGGRFMSQLVVGSLLQDIPVGILSGSVDLMMHVHHIGMLLVSMIGLGYFSPILEHHNYALVPIMARYAPFFFGVIELSSIPLSIVDMFHPHKQPEWHRYHLQHKWLCVLNEISRYSFAVLYILVRMIYFPYVITQQMIPDCWRKLNFGEEMTFEDGTTVQKNNHEYKLPIEIVLTTAIFFTLLQLYWGILVVKQVVKALSGGGEKEEDNPQKGDAKAKPKPKIKAV